MIKPNLRDLVKKVKTKHDTMNESDIQKVYDFPIDLKVLKKIQIKNL